MTGTLLKKCIDSRLQTTFVGAIPNKLKHLPWDKQFASCRTAGPCRNFSLPPLSRPKFISHSFSTPLGRNMSNLHSETTSIDTDDKLFSDVAPSLEPLILSEVRLARQLGEELAYEEERKTLEEVDAETQLIAQFQTNSGWKITDNADSDEITLTKVLGRETITVHTAISYHQARGEYEQDDMVGVEKSKKQEQLEREPISRDITSCTQVVIRIMKHDAPGSITINAIINEGEFDFQELEFYKDPRLGVEMSVTADWDRKGLYAGPTFSTLDTEVQRMLQEYLLERGINSKLAIFLPEYVEYKEQREYKSWLQGMHGFLKA